MSISDTDKELLSAYLDGELDTSETLKVKERLLSDPEFNSALQKIKALDVSLKNALVSPMDEEPVPDDLASLLALDDEETATPDHSERPEMKTNSGVAETVSKFWYLPVAASVAIVFVLSNYVGTTQPDLLWQRTATALETLSDMEVQPLNEVDNSRFVAVQSFEHHDGRLCREYYLETPESSNHAIACKNGESWDLEVSVATSNTDQSSYATASNQDEINAFIDKNAKQVIEK